MRYRKILVSGQILVHMCTEGHIRLVKCIKGLPEGTRFAYVIPETTYGIWVVVEHESFDLLEDGQLIPLQSEPQIELITDNEQG